MRASIKTLLVLVFTALFSLSLQAATMTDIMKAVKAKDFKTAFEQLQVLSKQGHPDALFLLGLMYERGTATEPDPVQAHELFLKAAEAGHPNAQVALASMLKDGRGVAKNDAESIKWLRKAAAQGSSNAEYNLGLRYATGEGVEKDLNQAVDFYQKAAEKNNMYSQFNLAYAYATGEGLDTNMVEAMRWAILSAAGGFDRAKLFVSFLNSKIEQEELDKAKELAQAWRAEKGLSELINLPEKVTTGQESDPMGTKAASDESATN